MHLSTAVLCLAAAVPAAGQGVSSMNGCVFYADVCEHAGQRCIDPTPDIGGWMCVCRGDRYGHQMEGVANCTELQLSPTLDECEACGESIAVQHGSARYVGPPPVLAIPGITIHQCAAQCISDPACVHTNHIELLPVSSQHDGCPAGTSCCELMGAGANVVPQTGVGMNTDRQWRAGQRKPAVPCSQNVCEPKGLICVDIDVFAPHTWHCEVPRAGTGNTTALTASPTSVPSSKVTSTATGAGASSVSSSRTAVVGTTMTGISTSTAASPQSVPVRGTATVTVSGSAGLLTGSRSASGPSVSAVTTVSPTVGPTASVLSATSSAGTHAITITTTENVLAFATMDSRTADTSTYASVVSALPSSTTSKPPVSPSVTAVTAPSTSGTGTAGTALSMQSSSLLPLATAVTATSASGTGTAGTALSMQSSSLLPLATAVTATSASGTGTAGTALSMQSSSLLPLATAVTATSASGTGTAGTALSMQSSSLLPLATAVTATSSWVGATHGVGWTTRSRTSATVSSRMDAITGDPPSTVATTGATPTGAAQARTSASPSATTATSVTATAGALHISSADAPSTPDPTMTHPPLPFPSPATSSLTASTLTHATVRTATGTASTAAPLTATPTDAVQRLSPSFTSATATAATAAAGALSTSTVHALAVNPTLSPMAVLTHTDVPAAAPASMLPGTAAPNTDLPAAVAVEGVRGTPRAGAPMPSGYGKAAAESVVATSGAMAAVSVVAGGAGTAVRLSIVAAPCVVDAGSMRGGDEKYPRVMSPLQLTVRGSPALGALMGNVGLVLAAWCVGCALVTCARGRGFMRELDVQGFLRFPSCPLLIFAFLYPGVAAASMDLVLNNHGPASVCLGCLGVVFCGALPGFLFHIVMLRVPLWARTRRDSAPRGPVAVALLGRYEWVSTARVPHWIARWGTLVRQYRQDAAWFAALDYAASFAIAAVHASRPETWVQCGHIKAAACGVSLLTFACEAWVRPHLYARNTALDIALLAGQSAAMALLACGYYSADRDHRAFALAQSILQGCAWLGLAKAVLELLVWLHIAASGRRRRLQDEEFACAEGAKEVSLEMVEIAEAAMVVDVVEMGAMASVPLDECNTHSISDAATPLLSSRHGSWEVACTMPPEPNTPLTPGTPRPGMHPSSPAVYAPSAFWCHPPSSSPSGLQIPVSQTPVLCASRRRSVHSTAFPRPPPELPSTPQQHAAPTPQRARFKVYQM